MGKFYITTPIYYVNDVPHGGHAYTTLAADTLARYHRLKGDDVWFLTGTDEHGQNVARWADEKGQSPQDYTDHISAAFRSLWAHLNISNDDFIRTTEDRHVESSLKFWDALLQSGDVYRDTYAGWYCASCEAFYEEGDLLEGKLCPIHKRPVEWLEEANYFFRLSAYSDRLYDLVANTDFVAPETRRNEVLGVIRQGLRDFSISRQHVRWGIGVPGSTDEVLYVWVDALSNYITALGYPDGDLYKRFWPADLHLMAKDIIRFHCLYWPAMLMAAGIPVQKHVYAHGYITIEGEKLSKTRGIIIDPWRITNQFGVDPFRYYMLKQPFGPDWDYTEDSFVRTLNADLADGIGNLLNRVVSMVGRYYDGVVPAPGPLTETEAMLTDLAAALPGRVDAAFERFRPDEALAATWELVSAANKYVVAVAPWTLAKARQAGGADGEAAEGRLATALYSLVEALRLIALYAAPFIPATADALAAQLGISLESVGDWQTATSWGQYPAGTKVQPGGVLFPKVEREAKA